MTEGHSLEHLIALFDDPDEVVSACVDRSVMELGEDVLDLLAARCARESDPLLRESIASHIARYNTEFRLKALAGLHRGPNFRASLYEGCFLAASLMDPAVNRNDFNARLSVCTSEYHNEISSGRTAVEDAQIFNHIFFHRLHFTLADQELRTERCALLPQVLQSHRGNPFALSLIYFTMAEEAGLPLYPMTFHGGFVPVWLEGSEELFCVNLLDHGALVSKKMLADSLRQRGVPGSQDMRIRPASTVLSMYFESLSTLYSRSGNETRAALAEKAIEALGADRYLSPLSPDEKD